MTRAHGTRARYLKGPDEHDQPGKGCRCPECKQAQNAFMGKYRRLRAQRQWSGEPAMVDADLVRRHVQAVMAGGPGWERIGIVAGVSHSTMMALLHGQKGYPPTSRMLPKVAAKLLAVRVEDALLPGSIIDATGTRRRLQALVALGWPISEQARRMGIATCNMPRLLRTEKIKVSTAEKVAALYAELSMTPAPESPIARRAREWAASNGWLPPVAWDDDLIDLTDAALDAELRRLAEQMSDTEVRRCYDVRRKQGDQSPLTVAAAREYDRRRHRRRVAS